VGLLIFITASVACCSVQDIKHLIILRFFQALGACACLVIPRAIVRDIFSAQDSARVFSHLMLVIGIAPIMAPIFGSVLLVNFGWKAIFVFLTGFGVLCLMIAFFAIPQSKEGDATDKVSYALKKYLGILHDRNFVICAISGGLAMAGLFAYITGSPFAYLKFFGLSSKGYSLIFALNSVGFIIAAQLNAYFLKRFSMEIILNKIIFIPAISGSVLAFISINFCQFLPFTFMLFIFIASIGAIVPSLTALALSNQSKHSGSASALLGTIQFSFAAITSFLVSKLHDGSLFPMALIIGVCGILACLVYKNSNSKPSLG
jgi:DHA1 family bicyclomycin/chloramphenicol resistance-like MFS transporter